jgi:two-component system response regulator HydG
MIRRERVTIDILAIGADPDLARQLNWTVQDKSGWNLVTAPSAAEAERFLAERDLAASIICVRDAATLASALEWLAIARSLRLPAIVVHDELSASDVLELLRHGAGECLLRPLNLTRLSLVLDLITAPRVAGRPVRDERRGHVSALGDLSCELSRSVLGLRGAQDDHDEWLQQLQAVAPLDTTVTITGETGTGKTRLSRLIHQLSPRRDCPMIALNCGACTESLLESEFFGHVRGAFTGADRDQAGKFALAEDGTLLLDEIDALSLTAQVKLLHVVEERVFQPVGANKFQPMRARLIVASNRNLETEVAEGRFRADLFYRLNVVSFHLPPLRERTAEIEPLAEQFAADFSSHHQLPCPSFSHDCRDALLSYHWPGNIRELRNVIERAVILASGRPITRAHLPEHVVGGLDIRESRSEHVVGVSIATASNKLAQARVGAERDELLDALQRNEHNRTRTALDLGISRMALYKRMRKFRLL